jgi:hypothetical protein
MKSVRVFSLFFMSIIVIAFSCFVSCSPKKAQPASNGTTAVAASPAVGQNAQAPAVTQGVVTFVDGTVSTKTSSDWQPASIGDAVPMSASVKTGSASSCDLQFGKASAIRVGPDTIVELKEVSLTSGKNTVDLGLLEGAVTCKVNKLIGRDRFQIGTKTAVCSVRGTRFVVNEQQGRPMKVAVQEGGVAILPPSFDAAKLDALTNSTNESVVDSVVDSIVQAAPVVHEDQELSIKTTDLAKADAIVTQVQTELESTLTPQNTLATSAQGAAKTEEKPVTAAQSEGAAIALPASITQSLKDYATSAPVSIQKTASLSAESKSLLEKGASLEVKESLPESPKATPATSPSPTPVSATQVPKTLALTVNATPQDAEILFDGVVRGKSSATSSYPSGTTVALKVQRRGYADYEASIHLVGESDIVQSAVLKPTALYGTTKVSGAGLVSGLVAADQTVFGADSKGSVFAFNADGDVLWSTKTENTENDNSRPVLGGGVLAFSGDKALAVLDASSGKSRFSVPLDGSSSGLFGRRPAIAGDKLFLATSNGIKVFTTGNGASVGTIALPDSIEMTPSVVGTTLYAVSTGGVFYIVDTDHQSVAAQIKTSAVQPIAAAPIVSGGSAYFVDRKGLAVRIDLDAKTVAWEKRLDAGKNLNVVQDSVLGDLGLYVFAKSTIYGISSKNGERLFDPIGGASSPPAIDGGVLWFGTQDMKIVAVDSVSGKVRATLAAPARVVGTPVRSGDLLAFPTESGNAIFVNPAVALH